MTAPRSSIEAQPGSWKRMDSDISDIERQNAVIIGQVIENPEQGLALLYDRYARDVNRLVWHLLGADADHDDIVQQVFLRMIQSVATLRHPERLNF